MWRQLLLVVCLSHACAVLACPNGCNRKGTCRRGTSTCDCFHGYGGADCSKKLCPAGPAWSDIAVDDDTAHTEAVCSNRGSCNELTGRCQCDEGFQGLACQRQACPGRCSGHGRCLSLQQYTKPDFRGFGSIAAQNTWDASKLHACVCDEGFAGPDCTLRSCSAGVDPLADSSKEKPEVQVLRCDFKPSDTLDLALGFEGEFTKPISAMDTVGAVWQKLNELSTLGTITVKYLSSDGLVSTFCEDADGDGKSSSIIEITFNGNAGDVPPLQLVHASTGKALEGITANRVFLAHTNDGLVRDGDNKVVVSRPGTTKLLDCAGRGKCSAVTGECTCDDGFVAIREPGTPAPWSECGKMIKRPTTCPGQTTNAAGHSLECSGHGSCSGAPYYQCECARGWKGHDCSANACPHGHVWFGKQQQAPNSVHTAEAECSAAGTCDEISGQCRCIAGFTGEACERMMCPGSLANGKTCNGHGQCLSMRAAAQFATSEFDSPVEYVYGKVPNDPLTWDFNKVFTCVCDEAYEGHDCSKRSCPKGDDVSTDVTQHEVQRIRCAFQFGASPAPPLRFQYKNRKSIAIPATASAADVKTAIEGLPGIANANIQVTNLEFSRGNSICGPAGETPVDTIITFDTTHDLEQLKVREVDTSQLLVTEEAEVVFNGHIENAVCNNKGLCNTNDGICECFSGWGSSDGRGKAGKLGDCGYRMPEGAANEPYVARTNLRSRIEHAVNAALDGV